jgi:diguanylate cyclase (GGDEF)-like protein/PAS domain S-box-containing protein
MILTRRPLARSPYLRQRLILGILLLAFGGLLAYSLDQEYRHIEAQEGERLAIHAQIVEKNLEPQIFSARRAIEGILADLPSWQKEKDGLKRANQRLSVISDTLTGIRTLLVINAEGTVIACNREEVVGLNVAHRDYFQVPLKNPNPHTLYVSPPFKTVLGTFLISFTRVISGPNGEFAGVVNASVEPEYFKVLLDSVRHTPDAWVYLAHGDGKVFLTMPERDALVDKDLAKPGTFFSRHRDSGQPASVFTGTAYLTGEERMIALRTLRPAALAMDKPLVVAVSRDLSAVFAPWREDAYAQGGLFGVLALVATLGLLFYQRRQRSYDRLAARHAVEQKAMLDNEVLLRNIIHALDEGVLLLDESGVVVFANPAAEALLGRRREELLGTGCPQLIQTPDETQEDCPLCTARTTRTTFYSRTVRFRRGDGSGCPVAIRATPTSGEDGGLVLAFYDISAEQAAEEKLAASERNLHVLIDAAPGSSLLLDREGRIETINSIGARRLASTPEELIGRDVFALLPPEVSAQRYAVFAGVCASGEPARMVDQRGLQIFESDMLPVIDAKGELLGVAVYAQDVTEKRREEALQSLFHEIGSLLLQREISLDTLAWHFCRGVTAIFGYAFAWIGRKQADGRIEMAAGAEPVEQGYLSRLPELGMRWDAASDDPVSRALRQGKMQVVEVASAESDGWQSLAWKNGARQIICLPLKLEGGTYGALILGVKDSLLPDAATLKSFKALGNRLSLDMEAALQQERLSLLEAALETTGNAVFIGDAHGCIVWANASFGRLTGYAPAEVIGHPPNILKPGTHDPSFPVTLWQTILDGNTWQGEVIEARRDGSHFTVRQTITPLRDSGGRVSHFVSIMEDVSEQKAAQERIAHLANYDCLTDLPNRRLFFDRLNQALALAQRADQPCALLFLDLDRFKEVNDRCGHEAGDQLLKAVAERLSGSVRESDSIARLGGDEFTVILSGVDGRNDCARVAEKIVAALGHPYSLCGNEERIGVSVGIALFPDDPTDSEALVGCADQAMYAAKTAGRGTFRFFSDHGQA